MAKLTDYTTGTDISKTHPDAFRLEDQTAKRFDTALSGKFPQVKINPLQARRCAQACGIRARTDAVYARLRARMGAALALEPDAPISENLQDLRVLQVARTSRVKEHTRLRNRGHVQINAVLKRQTKTRLALIERQIAELNAEIAKHIAEGQAMARKREIPVSVPGLGPIAAALILTFWPEIGLQDRKQSGSRARATRPSAWPRCGRPRP